MKYTLREILETNKHFKLKLVIDWFKNGKQFEQTRYETLDKALKVIPTKQLDNQILSNHIYLRVEFIEIEYQE